VPIKAALMVAHAIRIPFPWPLHDLVIKFKTLMVVNMVVNTGGLNRNALDVPTRGLQRTHRCREESGHTPEQTLHRWSLGPPRRQLLHCKPSPRLLGGRASEGLLPQIGPRAVVLAGP
jgi:hypothetical protein